jgi:hypothetical protein
MIKAKPNNVCIKEKKIPTALLLLWEILSCVTRPSGPQQLLKKLY